MSRRKRHADGEHPTEEAPAQAHSLPAFPGFPSACHSAKLIRSIRCRDPLHCRDPAAPTRSAAPNASGCVWLQHSANCPPGHPRRNVATTMRRPAARRLGQLSADHPCLVLRSCSGCCRPRRRLKPRKVVGIYALHATPIDENLTFWGARTQRTASPGELLHVPVRCPTPPIARSGRGTGSSLARFSPPISAVPDC
jgi:hypothetical protein